MTKKKLGMTTIVDNERRLVGIITDGDLRRLIERKIENPLNIPAKDVMTKNPKKISKDDLAIKALSVMEENKITSLIIVDEKGRPKGVIHIHDILRAKIV